MRNFFKNQIQNMLMNSEKRSESNWGDENKLRSGISLHIRISLHKKRLSHETPKHLIPFPEILAA